jgi:hypothetical protein
MISREELYELVWSKPMTKVAEQFKVSGSYMARVHDTQCAQAGIANAIETLMAEEKPMDAPLH